MSFIVALSFVRLLSTETDDEERFESDDEELSDEADLRSLKTCHSLLKADVPVMGTPGSH